MSYVSMTDMLVKAGKEGYAVGAFNVFNYRSVRAVLAEAEALRSPVILQTSMKTVRFYGAKELARIVIPLLKEATVPVAFHMDHCRSVELAKECADAGWSSIMYDGSACTFEENVANTLEVINYVKGRDISVEGELGAVVGVEDNLVFSDANGSLADTKLSVEYVSRTGVDVFAPAIGTAHGVYKSDPQLAYDRFTEIRAAVPVPLVVHGGTGLSDEVFHRLIGLGASKINVSTALKITYRDAMRSSNFNEPLKADSYIESKIRETAGQFMRTFGSCGRA